MKAEYDLSSTKFRKNPYVSKLLTEIHPGEILLEDFMKPMGITVRQLSTDIDVPPSRVSEIVNGIQPITPDTALRLGLFFSMEPSYWLNLQAEYDMRMLERTLKGSIAPQKIARKLFSVDQNNPKDLCQ